GKTNGTIDILPKYYKKTPMLITGHSGQSLEWIAEHSDGWLYYPRDFKTLPIVMQRWREAIKGINSEWKPFMQSLYIDLTKDPKTRPTPIHLGFNSGTEYLKTHLELLEAYGVNHVILNLKYGSRPAEEVIEEIGENLQIFLVLVEVIGI